MPSESSDLLDLEEVLICFRQITGGPRSSYPARDPKSQKTTNKKMKMVLNLFIS
jgi:hypothetical protein